MTNTIFLIATNKYKAYLHQAIQSIKNHWQDTDIKIFTDEPTKTILYDQYKIDHKPWPYPTLLRFHYFLQAEKDIKSDYVYYMDVDARFVNTPHVQGDLVAVQHCGYYFHPECIPQEPNQDSIFSFTRFEKYYGGGFFGGKRSKFFELSKWCKDHIDMELHDGRIPIHNDETVLNSYLTLVKPTLELDPSYHYPENTQYFIDNCWDGKDFEPVLLLLEKDHAAIRS